MKKQTHPALDPKHRCTKDSVMWKGKPSFEGVNVVWIGVCKCGRKVYEVYEQTDELYDLETNEEC